MSVELSAIFSRYVNGFLRTLNTASIDGGGRGREREGGNYTQSILRTPEREGGGGGGGELHSIYIEDIEDTWSSAPQDMHRLLNNLPTAGQAGRRLMLDLLNNQPTT